MAKNRKGSSIIPFSARDYLVGQGVSPDDSAIFRCDCDHGLKNQEIPVNFKVPCFDCGGKSWIDWVEKATTRLHKPTERSHEAAFLENLKIVEQLLRVIGQRAGRHIDVRFVTQELEWDRVNGRKVMPRYNESGRTIQVRIPL